MLIITWAQRCAAAVAVYATFRRAIETRRCDLLPASPAVTNKSFNKLADGYTGGIAGLIPGQEVGRVADYRRKLPSVGVTVWDGIASSS